MENTKCTRCELLVKEVERVTNGRNGWFDRATKAEKERDEWIAAYERVAKEVSLEKAERLAPRTIPGTKILIHEGNAEKYDPRYRGPNIPGGSL